MLLKNLFAADKILFEENKKQWPAQAKFRVGVGNGTTLFLEKDKFTYVKYDPAELEAIHEKSQDKKNIKGISNEIVHLHAFQMNFTGSNADVEITAKDKAPNYNNYFIGNDPSKWSSEVGLYAAVNYKNIYPDIDIDAYQQGQNFKYDFIIAEGGNPAKIKMEFNGMDKLIVKHNKLIIKTSTGDIIENIPYSYQLIDGKKHEIECEYELSRDGKTVSFNLPKGYNHNYPLTIDPILVGASFTGSSSSTTSYGHCAAYDPAGNIYTGGQCFGAGYPVTVGAFQSSFSGYCDIAISKLNPNASNLIWATYVGGTDSDVPYSLFIPANGEIYILGASTSSDYPTSAGCFDNSYNGGSDIVVTHLNSTGTALIGSTYVGGSGEDGGGWGIPWSMNTHDSQRGEIIADAAGNAWVASFTNSGDFPTSAGAYSTVLNGSGTYDGVAFRLSNNLSAMQWGTFLGGTGNDGSYALRLNQAGELFVTGCTGSSDFPNTAGVYDQTFNGGTVDGYITKFNPAGTAVLSSTFFGTNQDDISYFLDLDGSGNPYVYGCSAGNMPVTPGVYSNAGSGNFVSKFNPGLTSLLFSTVFGDGPNGHLEPEAFMVDSCQNIYMSGFGSSDNYPVTTDALYSTQASALYGSCYFFVLSKDALTQLYGSFYYGTHVDGGTSRFDPSGTIYQGICMPGGSATTPSWAWDTGASLTGYDMFVVKIAFQLAGVNAIAAISPNDTVCLGSAVHFVNTSNGVTYSWDFGDGSAISTSTSPTHNYAGAGIYHILFTAVDSASCNIVDTAHLTVTVLPQFLVDIGNDTALCGIPNIVLNAGTSGIIYTWSTGVHTQIITAATAGNYWVTVSNGSCSASDTVDIQILNHPAIGNDTSICLGQSLTLNSSNAGSSHLWSTGATTQTISVTASGLYWVTVSAGTCQFHDTINAAFLPFPIVDIGNDTAVCLGNPVTFNCGNPGSSYLWSNGSLVQSIIVNTSGTYYVAVTNSCATVSDTVEVASFSCDLSIPNVITPNGQGIAVNELFYMQNLEFYPNSSLIIFDRWGLKLFETDNYLNNWSGSKYSDGVYYYILSGPKIIKPIAGFFQIMR